MGSHPNIAMQTTLIFLLSFLIVHLTLGWEEGKKAVQVEDQGPSNMEKMQSLSLRKTRETNVRKRTTLRKRPRNNKKQLLRKNKGTADQSTITRKKLHKSKEKNKH